MCYLLELSLEVLKVLEEVVCLLLLLLLLLLLCGGWCVQDGLCCQLQVPVHQPWAGGEVAKRGV